MLVGKHLEERVKRLLSPLQEGHKKYQQSDLVLMSRIWFDDLRRLCHDSVNQVSALDFLDMLRNGKLTKSESVTRCRRKLQAKHPELRDDKVYKGRQNQAKKMREQSQYY
mgnify:CR=1 FL=1|tara:strand:- start:18723 stop:19052 length:330 start_codon:yes stop_codon:yes gene_type:complete